MRSKDIVHSAITHKTQRARLMRSRIKGAQTPHNLFIRSKDIPYDVITHMKPLN